MPITRAILVLVAGALFAAACVGDAPVAPPASSSATAEVALPVGAAANSTDVGVAPAHSDQAGPPPASVSEGAAPSRTAASDGVSRGSSGGSQGAADRHPSEGDNPAGIAAATPAPTVAMSIPVNETIVVISAPTSTPTRTPTPQPTATPAPGGGPTIGGCAVFPSNNAWNANISAYPVHANSANFIAGINATGGTGFLHADFGGGGAYGIPYIVVPSTQPMVPVVFTDYGDESDPGPYPIPLTAPIEGGSDAHVLAVRQGECKLYELFASYVSGGSWFAASGAVWNLNSNALRPAGWTSADAAGLPILAGLARYDEAQAGVIKHALRFTVSQSQRGYILPATHWASSSTDPNRPPMGLRLRLKASYDISGYTGHSRVILQALKTYGMIVADNGSNWFISGAADTRWDDDDLNQLKLVPGSAFEAVNTGPIVTP